MVWYLGRSWTLRPGVVLVIGRGRACDVRLPQEDDHLSRRAASLELLDDCVLVRNLSTTKPLVLRPATGEDRVVEPEAATTSLPHRRFSLVLIGRGGGIVEVAVDARGLASPDRVPGSPTRTPMTANAPIELSPAQRRVLVALCAPLLTGSGPGAVPATYNRIGEVLALRPQYVRNVIKSIREELAGYGVPGLTTDDDSASHDDFRWSLARWAVRSGWVTAVDVAGMARVGTDEPRGGVPGPEDTR